MLGSTYRIDTIVLVRHKLPLPQVTVTEEVTTCEPHKEGDKQKME